MMLEITKVCLDGSCIPYSPSGSVFLFCVVSMVLEAMYPPPNVRMKVCVRARIFGGMSVFKKV